MHFQSLNQSILKLVLFLGIIFLVSCNHDDNPTNVISPNSTNQIIPLKVGNQWNFTVNYYDSSNILQSGYESIFISRDTMIGATKWYEMPVHLLCVNDSTGFRTLSEPSNQLLFKYPTNVGDKYSWYGDTISVLNIDTLITVPAGTFHCIQYHFKSNSSWFISPNIGYVKFVANRYSNSNQLMVYYWESLNSVILK